MTSGSPWSETFIRQIADNEVRNEYVAGLVRARIASLIRALREQPSRNWSQAELAEKMGTSQSAVSRIEDPDYGKLSLQTLFAVAAAFKLPLFVDLPEWEDWFRLMEHGSALRLHRRSFDIERLTVMAPPNFEVMATERERAVLSPIEATGSVIGSIRGGSGQPELRVLLPTYILD